LNLLLYTAGIRVNWQVMPHRDDKICAVLATAELLLYLTGSPAAGMPLILSAQQSLSDTSCNDYRHLYLIIQSRAVNLGRHLLMTGSSIMASCSRRTYIQTNHTEAFEAAGIRKGALTHMGRYKSIVGGASSGCVR
jgi:hypothetical protein